MDKANERKACLLPHGPPGGAQTLAAACNPACSTEGGSYAQTHEKSEGQGPSQAGRRPSAAAPGPLAASKERPVRAPGRRRGR